MVLPTSPSGRCWYSCPRFAHEETELREVGQCYPGVEPGSTSRAEGGSHTPPFPALAESPNEKDPLTVCRRWGGEGRENWKDSDRKMCVSGVLVPLRTREQDAMWRLKVCPGETEGPVAAGMGHSVPAR